MTFKELDFLKVTQLVSSRAENGIRSFQSSLSISALWLPPSNRRPWWLELCAKGDPSSFFDFLENSGTFSMNVCRISLHEHMFTTASDLSHLHIEGSGIK